MAKKDNVVTLFIEQVGIPELFGIIIGVPAMITLIVTIWDALTQTQQITIIVCVTLIIGLIIWFIYGRVRKVFLIIPHLLYRKHKLAESIAKGVVPTWDEKNMGMLLDLAGVDVGAFGNLFDGIVKMGETLESTSIIETAIETAIEQAKGKGEEEKDIGFIISEFMAENSGFLKALENNVEYKRLDAKMTVWKDKVPTREISEAINDYERDSYLLNSFIPLRGNQFLYDNLPLKPKLRSKVNSKKTDDEMRNLLAKVRQSIINYYRG